MVGALIKFVPSMPRAPVALPTPNRHSSRLAEKPQLSAADKALRVLLKKMGIDVGEMPLVKAMKEFANTCKFGNRRVKHPL